MIDLKSNVIASARTAHVLFAGVAAISAGCGALHISGLPGSGAHTTAGATTAGATPPPAGAPGGVAKPADGADPDLVKAYMAIDWKSYSTRYRDPGAISQIHLTALDSHGKPQFAASPDAAWLPGWDPKSGSSVDLPFQVAQAGINRTWQAACFADYTSYRAGWKKLEETFRPKLEAARAMTNFYTRTAALRELYAAVGSEAAAQKIDLAVAHPAHWAGLRWEIGHELITTTIGAKLDVAMSEVLGAVASDLDQLLAKGRAYASDDAVERDAFCASAMAVGTQQIGPLPTPAQTGFDFSGVTFPVSDQRARAVKAEIGKLAQVDRPERSSGHAASLDDISDTPKEPVLVHLAPENPAYVVDKIERKGEHVEVWATASSSSAIGYDCRSTSKVESYTDGGQPLYHKDCKTGTETRTTRLDVTFEDLPDTVAVTSGNSIFLYGEVSKIDRKSKVERGGAQQTHTTTVAVRGRYLSRVKAK